MVDNCYGEFVDLAEPSDVGADMVVGSLIKNPGGGLAPIGGYICGTRACVDRCAYRLSAPRLGPEVGQQAKIANARETWMGIAGRHGRRPQSLASPLSASFCRDSRTPSLAWFQALVDLMNVYIPQFTGEITDGLKAGAIDMDGVWRLVVLLHPPPVAGGSWTCIHTLRGTGPYPHVPLSYSQRTSLSIQKDMQREMFAHLETLSLRYFNEHKTGDLLQPVGDLAGKLGDVHVHQIHQGQRGNPQHVWCWGR